MRHLLALKISGFANRLCFFSAARPTLQSTGPPASCACLRPVIYNVMRLNFVRNLFISLSLLSLLAGCSTLGYDHRERIAKAVLHLPSGALDEKALSGALMEKFSNRASSPAALSSFVEALGGKCSPSLSGSMSCSIPQSGSFCISSRIDIDAVVSYGAISTLRARSKNDGC